MKNQIPIVLAADNNYRYPLMVTALSAIMNADADTVYQFHILTSDEFEVSSRDLINNLLKQYNMPEATFYDMGKSYSDITMQIKHISHATFYRLQLPELLGTIEKCIYLDVDIVVKKDLKEFFNTDMEDKYVAGVKAAGYYYPEEKKARNMRLLGLDAFDQYVNAGVLLINLQKMREDNLSKTFEKLLEKNFPSQDQDILNVACYNHIRILPPKYNAMTKYSVGDKEVYDTIECLPLCYSREEWEEACESPVIIHYADKWKPWQDLRGNFVDDWWKYIMIIGKQEDCSKWIVENISRYEEDTVQEFERKKTELNTKLKQVQAEKKERSERVKTLKERVEAQKSRIQEIRELLADTRDKLTDTRERFQETRGRLRETRSGLRETQSRLNEVSAELENLKREKEQLEKHLLVRIAKKIYK